jgi:hypothetical protein
MALDLDSAAKLWANILYRRIQHKSGAESQAFWTPEARLRADKLAVVAGVGVPADATPDSLYQHVCTALTADGSLGDRLEAGFPELSFARLFRLVAERLAECLELRRLQAAGHGRAASRADAKVKRESPQVQDAVVSIQALVGGAGPRVDQSILETALFFHQRTTAAATLAFGEPLPFPWTQYFELDAISESRRLRSVAPVDFKTTAEAELVGLALSGGGIRSATLGLGVLQALAELDLLRYTDYLSTVSGGGYIGSWLHSWIKRAQDPQKVCEALSPAKSPDPLSGATHPIKWLRQYSNYLAPRLGLLSADTWSIFTIWARNTLLNMIVIVLALAGCLMAPLGARGVFDAVHRGNSAWLAALLPLGFAIYIIQQNLSSFASQEDRKDRPWYRQQYIHFLVALPVMLSAMLVAAWLSESARGGSHLERTVLLVAGSFFALLCYVSFFGDYRTHFFDGETDPPKGFPAWLQFAGAAVFYNAIAAGAGGFLLVGVERLLEMLKGPGEVWFHLVVGTTAVVLVFSLVIILHLGLFGRGLPDDRREWWSRAGAVLSVWLVGWVGVAGISIYGVWLLLKVLVLPAYGGAAGPAIVSVLGSGWLGTTGAAILTARGKRLLMRIAPPVFVVGLLLLVAFGVTEAIAATFFGAFADLQRLEAGYFRILSWWEPAAAWLVFGACLGLAYVLARRFDVNQFSMHNFYENRLVRCYQGASHEHRHPNRFTGFDPEDDFTLASLDPGDAARPSGAAPPYRGPYPIVNTCLNLVSGEELAWQERKGESFIFTPRFSGFASTPTEERSGGPKPSRHLSMYGYRPTSEYAYPDGGIRMGKAVAISGAAASPNMGSQTSPATAFLLTVFNVRLGWWIGNPRHRKSWQDSGPRAGLAYLLTELAAAANNKSKYVYLSDGGHFENLGIYELVRRRCRYIVVSDGGQDDGYSFEDLGNAVRKCRADFGVEIKIDLSQIRPQDTGNGQKRSVAHCAVGVIEYPGAPRGTLVYLKASLTGDEPADVLEYAALHPEFPHQPTADQFFDESQFESYRRLGYDIGLVTFGETVQRCRRANGTDAMDADRAGFFSELGRRWQAPSPKTTTSFTRHAEVLVKLMHQLRQDPDLAFLETQISPEWERLMHGAEGTPPPAGLGLPGNIVERCAGFHFCNSLLQLMEDVYLDLSLDEESEHPDNSGWMNLFRHWTWSAMFRATWLISASCYGTRFRSFCENRLELSPARIGRIHVSLAQSATEARLNFRERALLASGNFDWSQQRLHLLELVLAQPDTGADLMNLTVGIAVVAKAVAPSLDRLAYFRIQDHLRGMGLARRMLDAMVVEGQCRVAREPQWHCLPEDFPDPVTRENRERLERLLNSAYLRSRLARRATQGGL